jgi:hypothetical protein
MSSDSIPTASPARRRVADASDGEFGWVHEGEEGYGIPGGEGGGGGCG